MTNRHVRRNATALSNDNLDPALNSRGVERQKLRRHLDEGQDAVGQTIIVTPAEAIRDLIEISDGGAK